jgi:hypothetical protein
LLARICCRMIQRAGDLVMRALLSAAVLMLVLAGCATITKGTTQTIGVDTPGVPGAMCTVTTQAGPQTVSTPGFLVLPRSSAALPVRCSKACYQEAGGILGSTFEAMTAGNLVVGGVIGFGVDAMSGAINKYPDQISIPMIPIPGCGQSPQMQPVQPQRQRKGAPSAVVRPAMAPAISSQPALVEPPEPQLSEADRAMNSRN